MLASGSPDNSPPAAKGASAATLLGVAASAVIGTLAFIAWLVLPGSDEGKPAGVASAGGAAERPAGVVSRAPAASAHEGSGPNAGIVSRPFEAETFGAAPPDLLAQAEAQAVAGEQLGAHTRQRLAAHASDHPGEGRALLLLAADEMRVGWWREAIGHYEAALAADVRLGKDAMVQQNLAILAGGPEHTRARAALSTYVGRAATPALEAELEVARAERDAERLGRLERALEALPAW